MEAFHKRKCCLLHNIKCFGTCFEGQRPLLDYDKCAPNEKVTQSYMKHTSINIHVESPQQLSAETESISHSTSVSHAYNSSWQRGEKAADRKRNRGISLCHYAGVTGAP